jgi:tetratricopeptide (TPR) repeat protein
VHETHEEVQELQENIFLQCQRCAQEAHDLLNKGLSLLKQSDFVSATRVLQECVRDLDPLTTTLQSTIKGVSVNQYNAQNPGFMLQVNLWHELVKLLCRANFALGEALSRTGDDEKALEYFVQAKQQAALVKATDVLDQCSPSMAASYVALGRYREAVEAYHTFLGSLSLRAVHQKGTRESECAALYNLGVAQMRIGAFTPAVEALAECVHMTIGYFYKSFQKGKTKKSESPVKGLEQQTAHTRAGTKAAGVDVSRYDESIPVPVGMALLSLHLSYAHSGVGDYKTAFAQHRMTLSALRKSICGREATSQTNGSLCNVMAGNGEIVAIAAAAIGGMAQCLLAHSIMNSKAGKPNPTLQAGAPQSTALALPRMHAAGSDQELGQESAHALRSALQYDWAETAAQAVASAIKLAHVQLRFSAGCGKSGGGAPHHEGVCHAHRVLAYMHEYAVEPPALQKARAHRQDLWAALKQWNKAGKAAGKGGKKVYHGIGDRIVAQSRCASCGDHIQPAGNDVRILPCFHLFHRRCVCEHVVQTRKGAGSTKDPCDSEIATVLSMTPELNRSCVECPICSQRRAPLE